MTEMTYVGGGAFFFGVPARNLTEEEAEEYAEIIGGSPLYEPVVAPEEAPAPGSAPAPASAPARASSTPAQRASAPEGEPSPASVPASAPATDTSEGGKKRAAKGE